MRLQQIIIALSLLSPSLYASMNKPLPPKTYTLEDADRLFPRDKFVTFQGKKDQKINNNFKQRFGYDIPTRLVEEKNENKSGKKSIFKAVSPCYIEKNKDLIIKVHDIQTVPAPAKKITKITQKKIIHTTNEIYKLRNQTTLLEKIISQEKSENEKLKKEIALKRAEFIKKFSKQPQINNPQNKHIAAQKKKNHASKKQTTTRSNPNTDASEKMKLMQFLMNKYQAQTPRQLKQKLSEQCNESRCLYKRFNEYCTWRYCSRTNNLDIDTNDPETSDSSDEAGSC